MRRGLIRLAPFLVGLLLVIIGCAAPGGKSFSADVVSKAVGMTQSGKIYFGGNKWRMESSARGMKSIAIYRADKKLMWLLMPQQKMYMEQKLTEEQMMGYAEKLPGEIERVRVGQERISGIMCDKYKITYKLAGTNEIVAYQWLSRDGIPIKSAAGDGSWYVVYKNVKIGGQPASLFELPQGYKKWEMPKMTY